MAGCVLLFPAQWADLSVTAVLGGSDNRMFRLGPDSSSARSTEQRKRRGDLRATLLGGTPGDSVGLHDASS